MLSSIRDMLCAVSIGSINDAVERTLKANQVFVYGSGRSGIMGKAFAMRLVQMGIRAFFIGESTTPIVESNDLVYIISNTGETASANVSANIVRRLGADLIVITGKETSKLAHSATVILLLKDPDDRDTDSAPLGTLFEASSLILMDCLTSELMARKSETEDTMRSRHAIWV